MKTTSDEILRDLLSAHSGNVQEIANKLHTIRRKDAHSKAKSSQPELHSSLEPADLQMLVDSFREPIREEERRVEGLDMDLLTIQDLMDQGPGASEDLIHALFRFVRKSWWAHWGPSGADIHPDRWTPQMKGMAGRK